MYKKLAALTILLASTNSFADCAAVARIGTGAVLFGDFKFDNKYSISINNVTNERQTYEVCREIHTQYRDHTNHYQASECSHVHINPHEGLQQDFILTLHTNYNRLSEHPTHVYADSMVYIRGECNAEGNMHKLIVMQE